jgi:PAS domain-containing protein
MGEAIWGFDWSKTPLGEMSHWPQSLRTAVNILLSSRFAMWMAWGPELTMLYNDAYRPTLGLKHPWALGKRASEVWSEIWPDIGPRIETVLGTGQATYEEGLLLFLERSGFPEETYHTFSYSPLADDDGRICGMLCVVTEETERLIGERRSRDRAMSRRPWRTTTEDEVLRAPGRT